MTTSSDPTVSVVVGAETTPYAELDRRATIENHLAHLRRQAGLFGYSIVPTDALAQMANVGREVDGLAIGMALEVRDLRRFLQQIQDMAGPVAAGNPAPRLPRIRMAIAERLSDVERVLG